MKRDISIYLKDILENMERIETFTTGMGYDDFVSDEKTHFAESLVNGYRGYTCNKTTY
jgi:uncharacterized protein with HEPN domain